MRRGERREVEEKAKDRRGGGNGGSEEEGNLKEKLKEQDLQWREVRTVDILSSAFLSTRQLT